MSGFEQKKTFAEVVKENNQLQQSITEVAKETEQSEHGKNLHPIVINECFGGFGLSNKAIVRYLVLKDIPFIEIKEEYGSSNYYVNKNNVFDGLLCGNCNCDFNSCVCTNTTILNDFMHLKCTCDFKNTHTCRCISSCYFSEYEIRRTDPILAQVVSELGTEANGMCARLCVKYLPKGTKYRINEYDGSEHIETEHDIRWSVI